MKRLALLGVLSLAACSSAPPFAVDALVQEWASYMNRDHVLVPGDQLTISGFQMPELTQTVTVSPEGAVSLRRLAKPLKAAGRTMSEFRGIAEAAYREVLPGNTEISVNLTRANPATIYVAGEVRSPGPFPWRSHMTLAQAISGAGGFLITAKPSDVLVVRPNPASGDPRSIRVNVSDILYGESFDLPMLPGDVVWCQTSAIADAGNWVELYIRRLLPFGITGATIPVGNNNNN